MMGVTLRLTNEHTYSIASTAIAVLASRERRHLQGGAFEKCGR